MSDAVVSDAELTDAEMEDQSRREASDSTSPIIPTTATPRSPSTRTTTAGSPASSAATSTTASTGVSPTAWSFVQMNMSLLPIARPLPVNITHRFQENFYSSRRKLRTPTDKLHRRLLSQGTNISPRQHAMECTCGRLAAAAASSSTNPLFYGSPSSSPSHCTSPSSSSNTTSSTNCTSPSSSGYSPPLGPTGSPSSSSSCPSIPRPTPMTPVTNGIQVATCPLHSIHPYGSISPVNLATTTTVPRTPPADWLRHRSDNEIHGAVRKNLRLRSASEDLEHWRTCLQGVKPIPGATHCFSDPGYASDCSSHSDASTGGGGATCSTPGPGLPLPSTSLSRQSSKDHGAFKGKRILEIQDEERRLHPDAKRSRYS